MRRIRAVVALSLALTPLALAACGGDDEDATRERAPAVGAPSKSTTPRGGLEGLPPGFVDCMAERGYELKSSADIHSAPAAVLQACFGH